MSVESPLVHATPPQHIPPGPLSVWTPISAILMDYDGRGTIMFEGVFRAQWLSRFESRRRCISNASRDKTDRHLAWPR